jgi:hypothetical protein
LPVRDVSGSALNHLPMHICRDPLLYVIIDWDDESPYIIPYEHSAHEGYCRTLKIDASITYALAPLVPFRLVAPWGDYCEQVDGYYDLDAYYVWLRCSAVDMDIDFNYDHGLWYVARYIGAHDPPKVCSVAVRGVHGDLSTFIMFFGGIGINTVSIDGIVVDTVSNNVMFDHDGLALSGVLPHASTTSCMAHSTGSFVTAHDVPYDHGEYEQVVIEADSSYLCQSTPGVVYAIVVADGEAFTLIGNVTLHTVRASGILTHKFLVHNQLDVAKLFVSTSAGSAYRPIHNMINTAAVVVPETTDGSQPKTSSLRALVESTRGHSDCIMPHISAWHACVESSTPTDTPLRVPLSLRCWQMFLLAL